MPNDREVYARVLLRNAGLRRLKLLTAAAAVATAALAGIFAGFAAQTSAARKMIRVRVRKTAPASRLVQARRPRPRTPPPPQLPPLTSSAGPQASPPPPPPPPPPPAPPVPAPAPPVVVSGGS